MKIIVNRGFDKVTTSIIVFKNSQKIVTCPMEQDSCEFDTKEGDQIVIKLGFSIFYKLTIAAFTCSDVDNMFYIHPTAFFNKWILANYMMFPGLFLLFYVIQKMTESDLLYNYAYAGFTVLWAFSIMSMGFFQYYPCFHKRVFKIEKF